MSDSDLIRRVDAMQACQVGPSDEWSKATKDGYNQAATDCAMNILRIKPVIPPTPAQIMADPRVKALVEALRKIKRVTDTPIQSNRKLGQYCYRWADIDAAIESVDAALAALEPKP